MPNRYHKAIVAMAEIIELRDKLGRLNKIVKDNLTVSEFVEREPYDLDENLIKECFEGFHLKGAPYYIEPAKYVKSSFVVGDKHTHVHLHEDGESAKKILIPLLLEAAKIK